MNSLRLSRTDAEAVGAAADDADAAQAAVAAADDAANQAAFTTPVRAADGRVARRSSLRIGGMWCVGCAAAIEQALAHEPGVLAVEASYGGQRASVTWDPALTRVSQLLAAIGRAGYAASPDVAASALALRRAETRRMLWRLFVAVFCTMQVMMYQAPIYFAAPGTLSADLRELLLWAAWLLSMPVVLFSAAPLFRDAWQGLRQRRIGMDLPVALGIGITFVVSTGASFDPAGPFGHEAYFDSLTMFVSFLLIGRALTLMLRNRVAAALESAVGRTPAAVRRVEPDGTTTLIALPLLRPGDRVQVLAGEAFPADGPIVDGRTEADEALLTGESRPVAKGPGSVAIAGSLNLGGSVIQRADRIGADTRYAGIVALVRGALADRPQLLRSADRIAVPFLWAVLALAAIAAAVWSQIDPGRAVWVAVSVLIVTCPCALSLAAPSALLAAAGALSRRGILVQRLDAIEALARIDTVCFDKTGTLTEPGTGAVRFALQPAAARAGLGDAEVARISASLASLSAHPVARALAAAFPALHDAPADGWRDVSEHAGRGIEARTADGTRYRLGARRWAGANDSANDSANHSDSDSDSDTTIDSDGDLATWLGTEAGLLARFSYAESLRADAASSVGALRAAGLDLRLLSGDAPARVRAVAGRLGIGRARGAASPADKLAEVAALQGAGRHVAMVGDGLNDAPVMARADVSFAMGGGLALVHSQADFTLMSGSLADIAYARALAIRTMRVVRQNLAWALAYNAACLPLAALGLFPAWAAGIGMATSSLVVVLNALRVGRPPRPGRPHRRSGASAEACPA